jgi:hypothetical protein
VFVLLVGSAHTVISDLYDVLVYVSGSVLSVRFVNSCLLLVG